MPVPTISWSSCRSADPRSRRRGRGGSLMRMPFPVSTAVMLLAAHCGCRPARLGADHDAPWAVVEPCNWRW